MDERPAALAGPLLVLAPTGRDAEGVASLLGREDIECRIHATLDALTAAIDDTVGGVLIADEALLRINLESLSRVIQSQPPWSDLPFIILTHSGAKARSAVLELRLPEVLGNLMFLERPLNALSLITAARSALRARRRQRQVGGYIARQAEAEGRLRESESQMRLLLNSMGEGLYAVDGDGVTTLCNATFLRMLGFAKDEDAIGRKLHDVIHHSHRNGTTYHACDCPIYQAAKGGPAAHVEGELFYRLDGSSFPVEYWVHPIRRNEKTQGAVCTFIDTTEQERTAGALRMSEEGLRLAQRAGGVGTFELDPTTGMLAVSEEFCRLWGLSQQPRIMLKTLLDMVHPEDLKVIATGGPILPSDMLGDAEYRITRADTGETRWIARRGEARQELSGAIRFVGVVYDITDRKNLEEELRALNDTLEQRVEERTGELQAAEESLRQSQKMEAVGQLTGGIAHDFNNMLQGVAGSLELMQRRIAQGRAEEAERYVDEAAKSVERAAALTHRLLAFARRQALQPISVEADRLIENLADLIRRAVGPQIEVALVLGDGAWPVLCDPNQLESALLNLAINARDAMPGGGRITIRTYEKSLTAADLSGDEGTVAGDFVEIAVSDTGTGMAPHVVARVFEPFFTTKPIGQGTGLGLSQLYGFMRQSNGVVRLESSLGHGTTVRLYLPRYRG